MLGVEALWLGNRHYTVKRFIGESHDKAWCNVPTRRNRKETEMKTLSEMSPKERHAWFDTFIEQVHVSTLRKVNRITGKAAEMPINAFESIFAKGFQRTFNDALGKLGLPPADNMTAADHRKCMEFAEGLWKDLREGKVSRVGGPNYWIRATVLDLLSDESRKEYDKLAKEERTEWLASRYETADEKTQAFVREVAEAKQAEAQAEKERRQAAKEKLAAKATVRF